VKSNSTACPTRSAPINIFGVYDINFALEPHCDSNELSLAFMNVTGESGGAPLEIHVSKNFSTDPPEIIYQQFPADGEIYLDYDQYTFLKTPGEYRITIFQFQNEVVCNVSSETVDFNVPAPLSAQVGSVSESYPDIPTGKLNVVGFSGGVYPYNVRIELDSASSFALPSHVTEFEEAGSNSNQQIQMAYGDIPAGRYGIEVMDSLGCILNLVGRVPLDVDLFIPNVFTPNGDGSNDVFYIRNLPTATNQLMITNRWGKEVFASGNYQNNWDGQGAADGIYFYRLQVAEGDPLTGWIEIIRGKKP
jgi:gliding motility-associated-like protein